MPRKPGCRASIGQAGGRVLILSRPIAGKIHQGSRLAIISGCSTPRVGRLIELNSNPKFLAPDQTTLTGTVALDVEAEPVRNSYRACDVQRRPFFGEVPDRAVDRTAVELDRGALESPVSECFSPFQQDGLPQQKTAGKESMDD